MSIIPLKTWYLEKYEPLPELVLRPCDLRLNKKNLLKAGLRAEFLEEREIVERSLWFERYLSGEVIELYVEGSGGYTIANIDITSQEIYLIKKNITSQLDPLIYLASQIEYPSSSDILKEGLTDTLLQLNQKRSGSPLVLVESKRSGSHPIRLNSGTLKKIRRSLLFIIDGTPISSIYANDTENPQLLVSPTVCIELGYALQNKLTEQILLVQMERPELKGNYPFDLPTHQQLTYRDPKELSKMLPGVIETLLKRFKVI